MKTIIMFISKYLNQFLKIFSVNLIIFFFLMTLELLLFFTFPVVNGSLLMTVLLLLSVIFLYIFMKSRVLNKYFWNFNEKFYLFLVNPEIIESEKCKIKDFKKCMREVKLKLKNSGMVYLPLSIKISLTSPDNTGIDNSASFKRVVGMLTRDIRTTYLIYFISLLLMLLPFVLLSLLLTIGMETRIKVFILSTGIIFFLFIKSSVIDPIFYLRVKELYFERIQSDQG